MQLPNTVGLGQNGLQNRNVNPLTLPLPRPTFTPQDSLPSLPGFYVDSETDIRPRDVPMDGSISFFPYRDLSKIAIRQWNSASNIDALTYVLEPRPEVAPQATPTTPEVPAADPQNSEIVTALRELNQGIASTFSSFANVLQEMRQSIAEMSAHIQESEGRG